MQQSFIGNLLLPDLGGLVADTLSDSVVSTSGKRAPSSAQFSDADSVFGALRSSGCGTVRSLMSSRVPHWVPKCVRISSACLVDRFLASFNWTMSKPSAELI